MTQPGDQPSSQPGSFGDAAAEMANETEVEAPLPAEEGGPAPADVTPAGGVSGVEDWIEEGGPLEPGDVDGGQEIAGLRSELAERTLDLQRLQAEYVNYKRRVERDRELVQQNATYKALAPITEVLDTVERAREHSPNGELEGGFKSVADQLERAVANAGLVRFGAVGDAFDPTVHEALSSLGPDDAVSVTTVKVLAKAGYKIGDRVVRAAQVLTVEPA